MANTKISALTAATTPVAGTEVLPIVQSSATVKLAISDITPGLATITAAKGGTGQTSYAVGDLLYASTTTALSKLADVATGNALISGGVSTAPSWGKVGLTTHVSGTLPTANGGTNLTSFTANGVVYASSTSALATGSAITFDGTNFATTGTATAAKLIPTGTSVTGNGLYLPATNSLGLSTNGTNAVYINASQNVGLGTSSPQGKLNVANGTIYVGSESNTTQTNNLLNGYGYRIGTTLYGNVSIRSSYNLSSNAASLEFYVASDGTTTTERMRIDNLGNVGIGTTVIAAGYGGGNGSLTLQNAKSIAFNNASNAWSTTTTGGAITYFTDNNLYIDAKDSASNMIFRVNGATERMRIDTVGNAQFSTGAIMQYAPAPTGIAAATTLTNAQIQGQIISATGTTYTITMPLGTTMETLATWATTNISYDFFVINTATGIITMAVNTGVTSLGLLTVAAATSAHFRIRRTAANTFVLYRLS
jgi:hypothetical protein